MTVLHFKTGRVDGEGHWNNLVAWAHIIFDLVGGFDVAELVGKVILENFRMGDACAVPACALNADKPIRFNAVRFALAKMQQEIGVMGGIVGRRACFGIGCKGLI